MLEHYFVILAVGAFLKNDKGEILIVKKSPEEKVDGGLWTIPGGKIETEEAIIDGLKREVKEEVGLDVVSWQWIGEDVFVSDDKYFHAQHFLCEVKETESVVLESKLLEYKWMAADDIESYEFPVNIKKRLKEILESKYERHSGK